MVMDYDIDPGLIEEIGRVIRRHGVQEAVALTSELAADVINLGLQRFLKEEAEVKTRMVKNRFFGGSIGAAGLLTVNDFKLSLAEYPGKKSGRKPGLILLPGLAFDSRGRDLTGCSYLELERDYQIKKAEIL